jgi:hypothetical protein
MSETLPPLEAFVPEQRRMKMAEQSTRGRNQDRKRVAGGQDHEVRYEADKKNVSKEDVKDAVDEVGNSRRKVEDRLDRS